MQEIKPKWNKFSVFNVDSLAKIQEKLKNKHLDVAGTSEQGGLGCDEKTKRMWL